jgi:hypothetical protein
MEEPMMTENEQYLAEQRAYLLQTKMKMYRAAEKVNAATEVYKCRRTQLHEAFDIINDLFVKSKRKVPDVVKNLVAEAKFKAYQILREAEIDSGEAYTTYQELREYVSRLSGKKEDW